MLLSAALSPYASSTIRDRGRQLFRAGAVAIESIAPDAVVATVLGSHRYRVGLLLEKLTVYASCSYLYAGDRGAVCKHI